MDESLTEQRRVNDEGLRIVKFCDPGRRHQLRILIDVDGTGKASHG